MKRIIIIALILAFPMSARAGAGSFIFGYAIGSMNSQQRNDVVKESGIPPACFFAKDLNEYDDCRKLTGSEVYSQNSFANHDDWSNLYRMFAIEYTNIIVPLQNQRDSK